MARRFRRIPKVSSEQKRSLEYLKNQTSEDTQILLQAREAFDLADSKQQVALTSIQKLCKEHNNTGLLFLTQADILEKCSVHSNLPLQQRKFFEDMKYYVRKASELCPENMLMSSYLGYLMSEGKFDIEGYILAIDQLNEAYLISNPTDPIISEILYDEEVERFMELFPTYDERIENARKNVVEYLAFCVLKLKLHLDHSVLVERLQGLGLQKQDKVKLYLLSLSPEGRQTFVKLNNIRDYLISSKKNLANEDLQEAISYYKGYRKWEFWMCCSCSMTFPDSSEHLHHVATTHFKELSQLKTVFPLINNHTNWFPFIKSAWKPVNTSTVIPMLEKKLNSLSSTNKKDQSTPESSSNADVQETPIEGSTFELLIDTVNSGEKTEISQWEWPFIKHHKRKGILHNIQDMLDRLLSENVFVPAHMNILIQRSMSKLDGRIGILLKNLGLEQTHYPLFLLNATQLQEILNLLQEMSDYTTQIFEQQSSMEETLDWSKQAFKINGAISLSSESLYLKLDESSFVNEPTSGNASGKKNDSPLPVNHLLSIASNSVFPVEDDIPDFHIPPIIEGLVTWLYTDHSSDESLKKWRKQRYERRMLGRHKLMAFKYRLEHFRKTAYSLKGVSVNVVPNDGSKLKVDRSIEATGVINNASELTQMDKLTLQVAINVHHQKLLLNRIAAYDYQPIVLSIVKTYFQEYAESIVDPTKKPDGAAGKGANEFTPEEKNKMDIPFPVRKVVTTYNFKTVNKDGIYTGFSSTSGIRRWPNTYIPIKDQNQMDHPEVLKDLCSLHRCFLRVDSAVLDEEPLLVAAAVSPIESYFKSEWDAFCSTQTQFKKNFWWGHISQRFRLIFRDIVTGLSFLFHNNLSCGDLRFNAFVTKEGKGRILPSCSGSLRKYDDVLDLKRLMKTMISFPFQEGNEDLNAEDYGLPPELVHFFKLINSARSAPPSLLLNHPYFLTIDECIDFLEKLRTVTKMDANFRLLLKQKIERTRVFDDWQNQVGNGTTTTYELILRRAIPISGTDGFETLNIRPYDRPVDIIRFFRAVHSHANDPSYLMHNRTGFIPTTKIAKDLQSLYPHFYTSLFEQICLIPTMSFSANILEIISNFHDRPEASSGSVFL